MTLPKMRPSWETALKTVVRSQAHLRWVRQHYCSVPNCLDRQSIVDAAHVRTGTNGGMGMKPGDDWTISLCHPHHAEQHRIGEEAFEKLHDIDMKALAQEFAQRSPALRKMRQS